MMYALPVSAESLPPSPANGPVNGPVNAAANAPVAQAAPAQVQQPSAAPSQIAAEPAAEQSPDQRIAQQLVQSKLVTPLSAKESERSRFSRVLRPAPVMRVRLTTPQPQKDSSGAAYMAFAIDTCYGFRPTADCWRKAALTGCVYPQNGQIFVQRGADYYPAAVMLGQKGDPTATVCHPPTLAQRN